MEGTLDKEAPAATSGSGSSVGGGARDAGRVGRGEGGGRGGGGARGGHSESNSKLVKRRYPYRVTQSPVKCFVGCD